MTEYRLLRLNCRSLKVRTIGYYAALMATKIGIIAADARIVNPEATAVADRLWLLHDVTFDWNGNRLSVSPTSTTATLWNNASPPPTTAPPPPSPAASSPPPHDDPQPYGAHRSLPTQWPIQPIPAMWTSSILYLTDLICLSFDMCGFGFRPVP